MEVSGLLHAPAASPPGKHLPIPIGYEAEWVQEPVWMRWQKKITAPVGNRTPV